jgi:hypothetical protein
MPIVRNQTDVPSYELFSLVRGLVVFPLRFVINGANITAVHLPPDVSIVRTAVGQFTLRFPRSGRGAWGFLTDSTGAVYIPKAGTARISVQATQGFMEFQRGTVAADPGSPTLVTGYLAMKGTAFS